jgi:hypothetical protein
MNCRSRAGSARRGGCCKRLNCRAMRNLVTQRALGNLFALCGLTLIAARGVGAEPTLPLRPPPPDMVGTLSCASVSCHGGGGPRYRSGSATGAEYVHWLGNGGSYGEGRRAYDPRAVLVKTDGDPHAFAAQRMHEPRFREVLRRASGRADGTIDNAMMERCAKCHDPGTEPNAELGMLNDEMQGAIDLEEIARPENRNTLSQGERELSFGALELHSKTRGIGCETCHGGARQWLTVHYQTGVSHEELLRLGMIDTKNLVVRAKLCAGCHVGSAEQDMNHDMIAAGHPPLRFEQASYEALLGRKHWDDTAARLANPDYEVQLWAAGRIAAGAAAVELLGARSQVTGLRGQRPWPEFAESNCLGCHQPLTTRGDQRLALRELGKSGRLPAWQTWNTALVDAASGPRGMATGELPAPGGSWSTAIERLRSVMEQSAFPDRQQVAAFTSQAGIALARQDAEVLSGVTAASMLEKIGDLDEKATWDEMGQGLAALAAARRALEDQGRFSDAKADEFRRRIDQIALALRFVAADREWPVLYSDSVTSPTEEVLRKLAQIRQDLLAETR